jgi:transposase
VRHILSTAALTATRHNPPGRAACERLRARGTPPKVAAMRKFLTIFNAMIRDAKPRQTA